MSECFDPHWWRKYDFAIADPAIAVHPPPGLFTERLVPNKLAQSAHLFPTLIDLSRSSAQQLAVISDLMRDTSESAQAPPFAILIKTNVGAPEVMRHWNAMQLAQPDLGRKVWLRLHDPRVLHQMLRILDPMQRKKLFGHSLAFTYRIGGEWVTAKRDSDLHVADHACAGVAPYSGPARWDWSRIESIGLVNRALNRAGFSQPALLSSGGALAEQLINRAAAQYGLLEQPDLIEFAARGLMTNPNFDAHPALARIIKPDPSCDEETSLADRLALIEEHIWIELRHP